MTAYILRRILLFIPTLLIVLTAVFLLIRLIPGDTVTLMVQDNGYAESADALRERLGIDKPIWEQYFIWLGDLAQGDLGTSLLNGRSALTEIQNRAPVSFQLGIMSLVVSLSLAVPIGVLSGMRAGTPTDFVARSFAIGMLAVPNFWLATLVIVIPSVLWNVNMIGEYVPFFENPIDNMQVMILPALIGGAAASGSVMRMTRTMILEVYRQDYVRTAKAKGLTERVVVTRHIVRNAMIPVITLIGLQIPVIISGSVIMETVFSLPGMGRFLLDNINQRDYPMVQAMTLLLTLVVLLVNLLIDLLYPLLDPRIEVSR